MDKDKTIVIAQCNNGYVVSEYGKSAFMSSDAIVFQTHAALAVWLGDHFSHRTQSVLMDDCGPVKGEGWNNG
jgi:hypothetical protein